MNTPHDELVNELATLRIDPPAKLLDRVIARWVRVPGPLGELYAAITDHGIAYVRPGTDPDAFAADFRTRFGRPLRPGERAPSGLVRALRSDPAAARTLPVDLRGLTEFERSVLEVTRSIPVGQTRPYAWVAREIGRPKAVRAVGSALGRNPVPIVIPCHRVTRSDGNPGEYVFGAETKERLLRAERVNLDEVRALARARVHYLASDTTGIVCYPTCADARRISSVHRVGFANMAAALRAGYRPCQKCRPGVA